MRGFAMGRGFSGRSGAIPSFKISGSGRCCKSDPGLSVQIQTTFNVFRSTAARPQQQHQRGICKFVRRLEQARKERRMIVVGDAGFGAQRKPTKYIPTPDPLQARRKGFIDRFCTPEEPLVVNDIHQPQQVGSTFHTVQFIPTALHVARTDLPCLAREEAGATELAAGSSDRFAAPSASARLHGTVLRGKHSTIHPALELPVESQKGEQPGRKVVTGIQNLEEPKAMEKRAELVDGLLRPLDGFPLSSRLATCMQLHRIALMPSAKHMNASGYLAVLRRLAEAASTLDSRALWRACAAIRNFRKGREALWSLENTATTAVGVAANIRKSDPVDVRQSFQESVEVDSPSQLEHRVIVGETAAIDALVRSAAVKLQHPVDLRLATRLLSCFASDFQVFFLPFYAQFSLNFGRQPLRASAEELSQIAFAFASLQLRDINLFQKIAEASQSILSCFAIAQLSRLLLAFVLVEIKCTSLLIAAAPHLERLAAQCSAEEIGRIAFTHAQADVCPPAVRRLLVARVPTALLALKRSSQIADLLVSARQMQLPLPFSIQEKAVEQLCLNDLDGHLFASVLITMLPLKALLFTFWQKAAASCLLRLLISTTPFESRALLLQAEGKRANSDEDSCSTRQGYLLAETYSESSHALSPAALADCFVCFAAIYGESPFDAGGAAGVAVAEQHEYISIVLAGLSHALCSSRSDRKEFLKRKQEKNKQDENKARRVVRTPVIEALQSADIVRIYQAFRRLRSSWEAERRRLWFETKTQGMTCFFDDRRSDEKVSPSTCSRSLLPKDASDSQSTDRLGKQWKAEIMGGDPTADSCELMKWIDQKVDATFLGAEVPVSCRKDGGLSALRDYLAASSFAKNAAHRPSVENLPPHVQGEKRRLIRDSFFKEMLSTAIPQVTLETVKWLSDTVASARSYSARLACLWCAGCTAAADLLGGFTEDMAAALACSHMQRHCWNLLERTLMRRFLFMLHGDALSLPDLLSCAYSIYCLYPYVKHRGSSRKAPGRQLASCHEMRDTQATNNCFMSSCSKRSKASIFNSSSCGHEADHGRACLYDWRNTSHDTLKADTSIRRAAVFASMKVPTEDSRKGPMSAALLNAVLDDAEGSAVLDIVFQRVAGALCSAYLRAQQDNSAHPFEQQHPPAGDTVCGTPGDAGVGQFLSTLEPYQQHALCSLLLEHVPWLPSFLLKALPVLSVPPLLTTTKGTRRDFSLNASAAAVTRIPSESSLSFTYPTVGAELQRLLQTAGIDLQRAHVTLATFCSHVPAQCAAGLPRFAREQREHTDCYPSLKRLTSFHLLPPRPSARSVGPTLRQDQSNPAPLLGARATGGIQADPAVATVCLSSICGFMTEVSANLGATEHRPAFPDIGLFPHVIYTGSDRQLYALKSEVGATLRRLQAEGWQLVCVPFCVWRLLKDAKQKRAFLLEQRRRLLEEAGEGDSCNALQ